MILNIVINTDNKYMQHAAAMVCSLFENNRNHHVVLHIMSGDLNQENKAFFENLSSKYENECRFYAMDNSVLKGVKFRKNRPLSYAAYYRLLMSSTLDNSISKVLYLDCDMIVLGDLSELFKLEIDEYAVAATLDNTPCSDLHRRQLHLQVGAKTFCSGIMMVNLNYWREHNVEPLLLEYAKRDREQVIYHDQDAFNYVFKDKWFLLPPKWNRYAYSNRLPKDVEIRQYDRYEYLRTPKVLHFAELDIKPWMDCISANKTKYIKYLTLSEFPSPKYDKVSFWLSLKSFIGLILFNYELYVKPYLPKFIIMILDDLKFLIKLVVAIINGKVKDFTILRENY